MQSCSRQGAAKPTEVLGQVEQGTVRRARSPTWPEAEATPCPWNELGNWGCGWDYRRRTASIEPEDGACEVSILHKAVQEERFEVVVVILADENAKDSAALCLGAIFLAKAVVAKLPQRV
ncbi:hypothetical protein ACIRG5_04810 [Lentzea sp. NPDC102401]|uniref:hypothetical protein n=1 Tax=Lentzea sp. NPDC102401 TaxID=3364128 RepID=UPI003807751B